MALISRRGDGWLPQWDEGSGIGHVASFVESQAILPKARRRISKLNFEPPATPFGQASGTFWASVSPPTRLAALSVSLLWEGVSLSENLDGNPGGAQQSRCAGSGLSPGSESTSLWPQAELIFMSPQPCSPPVLHRALSLGLGLSFHFSCSLLTSKKQFGEAYLKTHLAH